MNDRVSILTPCYNSEKFISRFIESILKQKHDNIELVIINDGSTDNTEKIIFDYSDKIKKRGFILNYHKKKNGGLGSAINKALKIMTGDYFAWCDSDNFYDENYVSDKISFFQKNKNCKIVRCDGYFVYENALDSPYRKFSDGNQAPHKKHLFKNAILEKNFHFGCAMVKTSAFDKVVKNREIYESREGQNWQILLPMFYKYRSYYLDKPLFYFVNRKDSISGLAESAGLKGKIKQSLEHEKILNETLSSMKIFGKSYYYNLIEIKYIERRIYFYKLFGDSINLLKEENKLKKQKKLFNKVKFFVISLFIKKHLF